MSYHTSESRRIHAEWVERMENNILRWEDSLVRLNSSYRGIQGNLERNQYRLEKATAFKEHLESEKTCQWVVRCEEQINKFKDGPRVDEIKIKLRNCLEQLNSVDDQCQRIAGFIDLDLLLSSWINS